MKRISLLLIVCSVLGLATACDDGPKDYVVTIKTQFGDMVAILYDETPKHKANFIKLAQQHYFDGTLFHRVIKDHMIQGGDPDSKTIKPGDRLGNGGPGYSIPAEFNPKFYHEKGALSAARQVDQVNPLKESSGSQFFIVEGARLHPEEVAKLKYNRSQLASGLNKMRLDPNNKTLFENLDKLKSEADEDTFQEKLISLVPRIEKETGVKIIQELSKEKMEAYTQVGGVSYLDGEYTVFGKVVKGLEIIDKIASLPVDAYDRPLDDVTVTISVEEVAKTKITRLYGYTYPDSK